jgi:hypothetical protein
MSNITEDENAVNMSVNAMNRRTLGSFDSGKTSHQQAEKCPYGAIGTRPLSSPKYSSNVSEVSYYSNFVIDMDIKSFFIYIFCDYDRNLVQNFIKKFYEKNVTNVKFLIDLYEEQRHLFTYESFGNICPSFLPCHYSRVFWQVVDLSKFRTNQNNLN